ncbi:MAG: hypothetical protein ONB48_05625 [candidate division KSB1 bacterium]|nr:hypothetical protein [candidate division KSB1 bacterium]MDZ7273027.1 hypothetical protein [candidate division KSB1 bacterium]MDZ7285130.1 hypothetical protein [candidate division KSB1 bacterium]MDZ7298162.1 hypothetical protein [candidate division KSB1 bacterium]MDZ7306916.1 hypothetical protein [candidate division KSB1 bacterium]
MHKQERRAAGTGFQFAASDLFFLPENNKASCFSHCKIFAEKATTEYLAGAAAAVFATGCDTPAQSLLTRAAAARRPSNALTFGGKINIFAA